MKRILLVILVAISTIQGFAQNHFSDSNLNTPPAFMSIYVFDAKIGGVILGANDEIALFDGDVCCGVEKLSGDFTAPFLIKAEKADVPNTGYTAGNTISVKIWDSSEGVEYDAGISFTASSPYGIFTDNESAYINIFAKIPITLNLTAENKIYDATDDATVSYSVSVGIFSGDVNVNIASGKFNNKNAGVGKTVTADILVTGSDKDNYNFTINESTTANITQKPVIVISALAENKIYDGTVVCSISGAELSGVIMPEVVSIVNDGTGTFIQGHVGNEITVITGMMIAGADAANYSLSGQPDLSADITKVELTVTADDQSKIYDGNVFSPFTVSYNGFVSGEDEPNLGGTLNFSGTATTSSNVGTAYVITPGGLTSSNYAITFEDGSLDITQKALTITADDQSKVYDGNVFSPFTVSYNGFISGDDETNLGGTLNFSGTAATSTDVGTAYVIIPGGLTSSNYAITFEDGSLDITQKALTITADNQSKIYDGNVFSPFTVSYNGFISDEDETNLGGILNFSGIATTSTDVGTAYVITPGGLTSSNYAITFEDGLLDITQKALTITADNQSKIYDDNVFSPFTVSYNGFINGEDETNLSGTISFSGTAATSTDVGTAYVITPGGLTLSNYAITFEDGSLDIIQKALTITADDQSKIYDGNVFSQFIVSYNGFISGEDEASLGGTLNFSGTAATSTDVGTAYVIIPGGLTSSNYAIIFEDGSLDITQKALTITADDQSKIYDGNVFSPFTVSYNGFISGEDETNFGGVLNFSGTATTSSNVGTAYVITPGGLTSLNYQIIFTGGTLNILETITGDTNGDGEITGLEIAGDANGDGEITGFEIAGDTNGDGEITGFEIAGDTNGDGEITGSEIAGDTNGDGEITGSEIAGDTNGDGKINSGEYYEIDPNKDHINIMKLFSPNRDGINDYWKIPNIVDLGRVHVKIFDRWGTLLFESTNYQNDWDGIFKGKEVPEGGYIYIIMTEEFGAKTGVLNLVR